MLARCEKIRLIFLCCSTIYIPEACIGIYGFLGERKRMVIGGENARVRLLKGTLSVDLEMWDFKNINFLDTFQEWFITFLKAFLLSFYIYQKNNIVFKRFRR